MFTKIMLAAVVALGLGSGAVLAAEDKAEVIDYDFSFEGPFGTFDKAQLQRGLQIYTESCSACHGLNQVAFRTLSDKGGLEMSEEQVKAYAKLFEVPDLGDDAEPGDTREGIPADKFPTVTSAGAPDLSLMAKGRAGFHGPYGSGINQLVKGMGGAEYIASFVSGFTGEEKEEAGSVLYQNSAFPVGFTAMPPPLEDGQIEYQDGSPNDTVSMAKDVAAFLMWTAEPKMMNRKKAGFLSVGFLILLTTLLYLSNKQLWAKAKRKETDAA